MSKTLKKNKSILSSNRSLIAMTIPSIVYFFIFSYIPMVGLLLAFKRFNYNDGIFKSPWNNFLNFTSVIKTGRLLDLTINNITYNLLFIVVGISVQVLTAILLSELGGKYFKKFAQSATLFPFFISWVVVASLFFNIFNYDYGVLNTTLKGLGAEPVNVYSNVGLWRWIFVFFNTWKTFGYGTVIYLAAITAFDQGMYEAAYIDGANVFQRIKHLTIPCLIPTILMMVLFNVGHMMRANFDLFYQLGGNNPYLRSTGEVIEVFIYRAISRGGTSNDLGVATAVGLYQSVLGLILILITNGITKKYSRENALF